MLGGEEGPAAAKLLELLVALGEVFGAERLVPVESAHISGVSYKNLGEAGLGWLVEQADLGARARIRATLNPAGMDMEFWREMGVPEEFAEGQRRVLAAFERMGVEPTCTCTPYLAGHVPGFGSQIAWAESSAVCFSNSVIGARTNRESGPTTIASAVTGLAALYGFRLDENRRPGAVVEVEADLDTVMAYSALGYVTGKRLGTTVPYFKGLGSPSLEAKKALGAACATSGGIALWHGEGVTPEAEAMKGHLAGLERLTVTAGDVEEAVARFTGPLDDPIIALGCPHSSLEELGEIAGLVGGRNFGGRLWVFTSRSVYSRAEEAGHVGAIRAAGGRVFRDTCMVVAPLKEMGWTEVATNSFKAGHYMTSMGMRTRMGTIRELLGARQ
ncbi:aconitase X catalytic domain-containing protein [Candidatus Bathyarchaeota archaeon]|nr:aconitase X catalytic domain-containing protein [Candidatus Bathyarchaeota archaeon]MBL7080310.1 aconitase X catalytic domain-containing protein [Candidatus Bathyarchaeota archaeon]